MALRPQWILAFGLAPIALTACIEIEPAVGSPTPAAPVVGVDLGSSGRVPQIAAVAGDGYGRTESDASVKGHGSTAPGTTHGSINRSAMPGMRHGLGSGDMQLAHSSHAHVQGSGTVNSVNAVARKVNVSHGPISAIGWPAMTMDFAVAPSVELGALQPGVRVNFQMEQGQDGMYVIQSITPTGGRN